MTFTKEELQHYEMLANFFDFEMHIDGEYPFYTDDRLLDESNKVKKNVYKDGKRTSVNMNHTSIQTENGQHAIDLKMLMEHTHASTIQFNNSFMTFIVQNWDEMLTNKQKKFIEDVMNGKEAKYTKQQRYQFRLQIQRRLKLAFIGSGGDRLAHWKIGEFRTALNLIDRFLDVDDDNDLYAKEIIKNIDKEFVNNIVYGQLSGSARQDIVDFYHGKKDKVASKHLYEFHEIILVEKERMAEMGLA